MPIDELAEIDGIKPKATLVDGEETEVKSKTSKGVYKVKRTGDHFYCTCPAWRNQKGVRVEARSCKHLQDLLGEEYEAARLKLKNGDSNTATDSSSKKTNSKPESKPQSKGKARSSTKRKRDEEDDEVDEEEEASAPKSSSSRKPSSKKPPSKKPASKTSKPAAIQKPASKGKGKTKIEPEDNEENDDDAEEQAEEDLEDKMDTADDGGAPSDGSDELAEIDGIKPKVYMADGEEKEVKSQTSNSTYKVKRTWDHFYCTCPAWRNQGGVPVNARSCKHLQSLLGHDYEAARVKLRNPDGPQLGAAKGKATRTTKKAKGGDDDGDGGKGTPELLLANKWDIGTGPDPTGWWISEKLDGVRTFYDGKGMVSRLGNPFTPPKWFLDKLPKDVTLDGELFGGRGEFQSTVSIVKTVNSPHWQKITFQVFDIPSRGNEPFEKRIEFLKKLFGKDGSHESDKVVVVEHEKAKNREHVLEKLKEIEALGGEGLMLRKPGSEYEGRRSGTLLKVKTFYDAEAIVMGYEDGKNKYKGVTGSLVCKMESGKKFNVGSGLTDKQRKDPPKIGTIITYRFQELTKDGVPRFPTFVGEAIDKKKPKDAEVPPHRKGTTQPSDD
ncbi:dna ligase [Moniliophthora roreri MCA 2997]|uniref:Dna ligase n=2 Tax=Moniliophthora roreri TaxID=221103 RepID=V2YHU7_MONRO|nr:dna ligase [Moniliophthora roreri MCA 2997]